MSDTQEWSVVEVGPHLQTSSNPRHSFKVMRVSDHEAAVDDVVEGAAAAIKEWREKCEGLEASLVRIYNATQEFTT
jgi:hypothetical protein